MKKKIQYKNTILESFYTEEMDHVEINRSDIDAINA